MNESSELKDTHILETVRVSLDQILDRVVAQSDRIEQLRSLAQRVVDELIIESIDASGSHETGAGDVDSLRERMHNQNILRNNQERQRIEGQTAGQADLQNVFNSEQAISDCHRSRSLIELPTCFNSNTAEPTDLKPSPSCKSLPVTNRSSTPVFQDSGSVASSPAGSHSDEASNATNGSVASNLFTEEIEYPKYELVKIVKTPLGVIKVHCNGDIDDVELDRIISESKKILNTRKQNDANTKCKNDKKKGLFSRVRKFFRRLCCCSAQEGE